MKGTWLALYPREEIARNIGITVAEGPAHASVTLAHNAPSPEEVDAVLAQAVGCRRHPHQTGPGSFLGRLFRLFPGSGGPLAFNPFMDLT